MPDAFQLDNAPKRQTRRCPGTRPRAFLTTASEREGKSGNTRSTPRTQQSTDGTPLSFELLPSGVEPNSWVRNLSGSMPLGPIGSGPLRTPTRPVAKQTAKGSLWCRYQNMVASLRKLHHALHPRCRGWAQCIRLHSKLGLDWEPEEPNAGGRQ